MMNFRQRGRTGQGAGERTGAAATGRELFELHLDVIERVIASVGRRRSMSSDEADDFASWARVKLLEDDCAILGKFRGKSRFKTYLVTVLANLFRDYRISKWGKFRPSAKAKRCGPTAERLETLCHRDGFSFDEAVEILRRNHGVKESEAELAELAASLPSRTPRRRVGEEVLEHLGDSGRVEQRVRDRERAEAAERAESCLARALRELEPESRLILKMHFEDRLTVAAIARTLGLDQKPLYRRIDRCLGSLRESLEGDGFTARDAAELLEWDSLALRVEYGERAAEIGARRPSHG